MRKILTNILVLLSAIASAHISGEYVYEFGTNIGELVYTSNGRIDLSWKNEADIPITNSYEITYVRVVVNALSPPKVDYDNERKRVHIVYSWTQVPASTYQIWVKGILH